MKIKKKTLVGMLTALTLTVRVKSVRTEEASPPSSAQDISADEATMLKLRAGIDKDTADMMADSKEVTADRAAVRTNLKAYNDAVSQFGKDSPQAKAAEATLDKAHIALHKELSDLRTDSRDLRKDRKELAKIKADLAKDRAALDKNRTEHEHQSRDHDRAWWDKKTTDQESKPRDHDRFEHHRDKVDHDTARPL